MIKLQKKEDCDGFVNMDCLREAVLSSGYANGHKDGFIDGYVKGKEQAKLEGRKEALEEVRGASFIVIEQTLCTCKHFAGDKIEHDKDCEFRAWLEYIDEKLRR